MRVSPVPPDFRTTQQSGGAQGQCFEQALKSDGDQDYLENGGVDLCERH